MKFFEKAGYSTWYWAAMIAGALALEAAALYYQYALGRYPCALCIHVRLWVLAFVGVGLLGLFLKRSKYGLAGASLLSLGAAIGLAERSWATLSAERGWQEVLICPRNAGLPPWFDLEKWLPAVFEVQGSCGPTPVIAFGITMAESLVAISTVAIAVTALVTISAIIGKGRPV